MSLVLACCCVAGCALLLFAEARQNQALRWVAKLSASTAFIAAALSIGATEHLFGQLILVGLILSWFGDAFLLPKEKPLYFQAGLGSFLLAHIAYTIAFGADFSSTALLVSVLLISPAFWRIYRWLAQDLPAEFRISVPVYMLVIGLMTAFGVAHSIATANWSAGLGAVLFAVSDIAVAKDQFKGHSFYNKLWGLPLYYGAQLILVLAIHQHLIAGE